MTVEDHSGDDESEPTAEEVAAYERWENASTASASAPMQVSPPIQKYPPIGTRAMEQKRAPVSHNDRLWEEMFDELRVFRREHGDLRITKMNAPSPAFYRWVLAQRTNQRRGRLSPGRQERLDALGFPWLAEGRIAARAAEHHDAVWRIRYAELLRFKEEHGHCDVEIDWEENPRLGRWVHRQRGAFKNGKLSQEHAGLLDGTGFAWESEQLYRRNMWETHFSQMADYIRGHGHDRMTQSKEPAPGLYQWSCHQRRNFLQGKLLPERQARLEAIGFTFGGEGEERRLSALEEQWETRFAELLRFKEQHGHASVPTDLKENPKLGHWATSQRHLHNTGKLSADRVKRLDAAGFGWTMTNLQNDRLWEAHFEQLVEFKRVHGHDIVAECDDPVLYIWRKNQRKYFRRGTLPPERIARLNAIGFGWTTTVPDRPARIAADEANWNEKFRQLQAFIARHGHSVVTPSQAESLAHWVKKQRERQRDGKLRADRKQRLDEVGFVWQVQQARLGAASKRGKKQPPLDTLTLWEQGFAALQEFQGQHGHVDVPAKEKEHRRLAAWLREQRIGHERGSLLFSQITRLEQLGVRWD